MTNTPDNLVLELLRALRTDVPTIKDDVRDLKHRFSSIEHYMSIQLGENARFNAKFDAIDEKFERISRRLELRDAD